MKKSKVHWKIMLVHWPVICSLLISLLVSAAPVSAPAALAAPDAGSVRVAYLYDLDTETAQSIVTLLNANGFSVKAFQLGVTPPAPTTNKVLLPFVTTNGPAVVEAQSLDASGLPVWSNYDLVVIGADTGSGATWNPKAGAFEQIRDSGLPVVGLGAGGHAFFGRLGLPIGHPNGAAASARAIKVADFGDSEAFYTTPKAVTIPGNGVLNLYGSAQPVISIALAEHLPNGVRLASLANNSSAFPVVSTDQRFLLWGFGGGPGAMTDNGRKLFVNAMSFAVKSIKVELRARSFTPAAGLDPSLASALQGTTGLHAYAQLKHLPSDAERAALEQIGIRLVDFVGDTLYTAFVTPTPNAKDPNFVALVRWLGLIPPTDKVDPKVQGGDYETWAEQGDSLKVLVAFHSDVEDAAAEATLTKYSASNIAQGDHTWAAIVAKSAIATLAAEDGVAWVQEGPAPIQITNDVARSDLNVNAVQNANTMVSPAFYAGLSGAGVTAAVFDTGVMTPSFTHNDLSGRIVGSAPDTNGHGSHVAGIIGGNGTNSLSNCPGGACTAFQFRGMAPQVRISANWGWNAAVWNQNVNSRSVEVSNHSYIMNCGAYETTAQTLDTLVRGELTDGGTAIPRHTVVWSAANQGGGAQWCTTGTVPDGADPDTDPDADPTTGPRGYYSILGPAKNVITVGAFDPGTLNVSGYSSRGPTFDGRLKPDVMASGCMTSIDNDTQGYVGMCGTSMATPAVTGVTALLTEQFHKTYPSAGRPFPSTMKAILIQTATDMVHDPAQAGFFEFGWTDPDSGQPVIYHAGPDWSTGYGAVNAERAAAAIRGRNFVEGSVAPGDTSEEYTINVTPGRTQLKFTLAWSDEPGNPALAQGAAQLVNNLDLTLRAPDNTIYRPWVLPALPRNANPFNGSGMDTGVADPIVRGTHVLPAFRAVDNLNNVEQVSVQNPMAGVWTVRVNAAALPNNKTQPFSLAGDFRSLNIVDPQTGNVAEAGDPANPNVILVVLEAQQTSAGGGVSTLQDADVADFSVTIDGAAATIVSGLPVGDQFWLNVRPQAGVYSGGSKYDLGVTWNGFGSDSETRAVLFTEREVTDRAIVIDYSGSMADYDKMAAAQNAARLFVDQSLPGDRIAVVGFSNNATTPLAITQVAASANPPQLNQARNAINTFTPDAATAIGKGLIEGQAQVTVPFPDPSISYVKDVIILLSDGMENVDPLYNTPAVKGVIEPTDTIVNTVAVGPASAGFHTLLNQIATENGGDFQAVTEDSASAVSAASIASPATTSSTGIDAFPNTLPNRLGDIYKNYAEGILDEARLLQARGVAESPNRMDSYEFMAPSGLKRMTFAVNWQLATDRLRLRITSPGGKPFTYDPKIETPGIYCRRDTTHETCIFEAPEPGLWKMEVVFINSSAANEYMAWVSAKTDVTFQLLVGTPSTERSLFKPVRLLAFVSQGEKPLAGQQVSLKIFGPHSFGVGAPLDLFDDGAHGDGAANDGIYGNDFWGTNVAGPYNVRGMAKGTDLAGANFELYDNTSFNVRPRALYIRAKNGGIATQYNDLIENNGMDVDVVHMNSVMGMNLNVYNLVILGPDTGSQDKWGNDETVNYIIRHQRPVLGLGQGGYAFFGKLQLAIGWPHGAHSDGTTIAREQMTDAIWRYPYEFAISKERLWQLYSEPSPRVDIFVGDKPDNVSVFGFYAANGTNQPDFRYADLLMENGFWMLWSFDNGPKSMTLDGQRLFVNTVYRTMD